MGPAALDEEPGIPACSSVTLTPSCLGSAQPWLLEEDPGTLGWQTPAWAAPASHELGHQQSLQLLEKEDRFGQKKEWGRQA